MLKAKSYLLVLLALLIHQFVSAQNLWFHAETGLINYGGDLQQKLFTFKEANFAVGAGFTCKFQDHFSVNVSFLSGKVAASDAKNNSQDYRRNLSFYSNIAEAGITLNASLKNVPGDAKFSPYVFTGVTVFHFNPYAYSITGEKVYLQPLGTEGQGLSQYPDRKPYQLTQFAIPFGAGIMYAVSDNVLLGAEIRFRKLFTDYLDDVSSKQYADTAILRAARGDLSAKMSFRSDELSNPLTFGSNISRGNPTKKDAYYTCMLKLSVSLSSLFSGGQNSYSRKIKKQTGCPPKVL